jgi:hypothetical protein
MAEIKFTISAEDKAGPVLKTVETAIKSAFDSMGRAGVQSSTAIKSAFDTLGIQSAASIEASKAKINAAYDEIARNQKTSIDDLVHANAAKAKALEDIDRQNVTARTALANQFFDKEAAAARGVASAYETLGVKSAASIEESKNKINAAYETIKTSGTATAVDITRAEAARAKAIEDIDRENFASRKSLLDKFKENWIGITAGLTAAWAATAWLRGSIEKAFEAEVAFNKLRIQVEGLGIAFDSVAPRIDAVIQKTSQYARVQDEDVAKTLQELVFHTGNVEGSLKKLNLVYDLAYQKGISASESATLIGKAMAGNVEMLGRYIPELHNLEAALGVNATEAQKTAYAFAVLEEKAKGALDKMTEHEKQLRDARKAWEDFYQTIGNVLLRIGGSVGQVFKDLGDDIEHGAPSLKALAFGHAEAAEAATKNAEAHGKTSKEIIAADAVADTTKRALREAYAADELNDLKQQGSATLHQLDIQHGQGLLSTKQYYEKRRDALWDNYSKEWDKHSKEYDRIEALAANEQDVSKRQALENEAIKENTKLKTLNFEVDQALQDNDVAGAKSSEQIAAQKLSAQSDLARARGDDVEATRLQIAADALLRKDMDKDVKAILDQVDGWAEYNAVIDDRLSAEISLAVATGEHVAAVQKQINADKASRVGMDAVTKEILDQVDALKILQAEYAEAHANDDLKNQVASLDVADDPYASGMESIRQRYETEKKFITETTDWKSQNADYIASKIERLNLLEQKHTKETELFKKHEWERGAASFADSLDTIGSALMQGNKKQFELGKKMAITSAVISTYLGAQQAFTSLSSIPYIGVALGLVAAAAAVAAGMQRVSYIRSQEYNPSYAVGTARVPEDQTANVHQGEIIIDAASADVLRRYGIQISGAGGNDTDSVLVDAMKSLKSSIEANASAADRVAEMLDKSAGTEIDKKVLTEPILKEFLQERLRQDYMYQQWAANNAGIGDGIAADRENLAYYDRIDEFGRIAQELVDTGPVGQNANYGQLYNNVVIETAPYVEALAGVHDAFGLIGKAALSFTLDSARSAQALVDLMGGMDEFTSKTRDYFDMFYSDAEKSQARAEQGARDMNVVFRGLGLTAPDTAEGFRDIVNSLDVTTESGRAAYAALMDVASSANAVYVYADQLNKAQTELNEDVTSRMMRAAGNDVGADLYELQLKQTKELQDAQEEGLDVTGLLAVQSLEWADAVREASETVSEAQKEIIASSKKALSDLLNDQINIRKTMDSLTSGPLAMLSPEAAYNQTSSAFYAEAGKEHPDLKKLPGLATAFLEASKSYNASGAAYQADLSTVLDTLGTFAPTETDILEQIKDAVDSDNINVSTTLLEMLGGNSALVQAINAWTGASAPGAAPDGLRHRTIEWADEGAMKAMYMAVGRDAQDLQYDVDNNGIVDLQDALKLKQMVTNPALLPTYDVGTPYVPYDQDARIHESEMVIDPVVSAGLRKYGIRMQAQGGDNRELIAEVKALREEMASMKKELATHAAAGVRVNQTVGKRLIEQGDELLKGERETKSATRRTAAA